MRSEVAARARFDEVRYGQVWEDADVLVSALDVQPGDVCVSIASAGDNALALLTRRPSRIIALDLSHAQLACLALRVAAFRALDHDALLELAGSRPSRRRLELYARCRLALEPAARRFWDGRTPALRSGLGATGRFDRYLRAFARWVLPIVHSRSTIDELLTPKSLEERRWFYERRWDTPRWRRLFRIFFSRFTMARLGRDRAFFRYARGDVANLLLARTRHAFVELDPAANPWLHWMLRGRHGPELPFWLRAEHFETIRANLDRLEWHQTSLEWFLGAVDAASVDRFNLSDVFEYVSEDRYHGLLRALARAARPEARLVYWNLLVARRRPSWLADVLQPLDGLSAALHARDRTFFYGDLVVEAVR